MSITASDLVAIDEAALAGDLWSPLALFHADGSAPMTFSTAWPSIVQSAQSAAEHRVALDTTPLRSARAVLHTTDPADTNALRNMLLRMGKARSLWPVYPDVVQAVSYSPIDNYRFLGDFSSRRIEVGQYVCLVPRQKFWHAHLRPKPVKVVSLTDNTIVLDDDPGISPAERPTVGSFVGGGLSSYVEAVGYGYTVAEATPCVIVVNWYDTAGSDTDIVSLISGKFEVEPVVKNFNKAFGVGVAVYATTAAPSSGFSITLQSTAIALSARAYAVSNLRVLTGTTDSGSDNASIQSLTAQEKNAKALISITSLTTGAHTPAGGETSLFTASDGFGFRGSGFTLDAADPFSATLSAITLASSQNHAACMILLGGDDSDSVNGGMLFPMMECDLSLSTETSLATEKSTRTVVEVFESATPGTLSALGTPGDIPSAFPASYDGELPVFDIEPNWATAVRLSYARDGSRSSLGLGSTTDVYGAKARALLTYNLLFDTRESAWDFLEFFDSRAGRTYPFWGTVPTIDLQPESITYNADSDTYDIQFVAQTSVYDWNWFSHLALVAKDGTVHLIEKDSVTDGGVSHIVRTEAGVALPSNDTAYYKRVCPAMRMRFDQDSIEELWHTSSVMSCSVTAKEVVEEKSVPFTVDPICKGIGPAGSTSWYIDQGFDLCNTRCGGCDWCLDSASLEVTAYRWIAEDDGFCNWFLAGTRSLAGTNPRCEGNNLVFDISYDCPVGGTVSGEVEIASNGTVWAISSAVIGHALGCIPPDEEDFASLCGLPGGTPCGNNPPDVANCARYEKYECLLIDGEYRYVKVLEARVLNGGV